jgi:hypothetical protein
MPPGHRRRDGGEDDAVNLLVDRGRPGRTQALVTDRPLYVTSGTDPTMIALIRAAAFVKSAF